MTLGAQNFPSAAVINQIRGVPLLRFSAGLAGSAALNGAAMRAIDANSRMMVAVSAVAHIATSAFGDRRGRPTTSAPFGA
jgi:hypothetical protein